MNWREWILRFAMSGLWIIFGVLCWQAISASPTTQHDLVSRIAWIVGAVVSFLAAIVVLVSPFTEQGRIRWLAPWKPSLQDGILVALLAGAGGALYLLMELDYIDTEPPAGRFVVLWATIGLVVWAVLSYCEWRARSGCTEDKSGIKANRRNAGGSASDIVDG